MGYSKILKINNYEPPQPKEDGFKIGVQKIWSKNTRRTASAKMVGDIKALKTTLDIAWEEMTQEQITSLDKAVSDISASFFSVTFLDQRGTQITKNFYADSLLYNRKAYRNGTVIYDDISLSLVEQ